MYKITIESDGRKIHEAECETILLAHVNSEPHVEAECFSNGEYPKAYLAGCITAVEGLIQTIYQDVDGLEELTQHCKNYCMSELTDKEDHDELD